MSRQFARTVPFKTARNRFCASRLLPLSDRAMVNKIAVEVGEGVGAKLVAHVEQALRVFFVGVLFFQGKQAILPLADSIAVGGQNAGQAALVAGCDANALAFRFESIGSYER